MLFEQQLLGPFKQGAYIGTHIHCLVRSAHPPSAVACAPPQSSAASVGDMGWPEGGSWWRDSACRHCSVPGICETMYRHWPAQQQLLRGRLAASSSLALTAFACWRRGTAPSSRRALQKD